VSRSNSSLSNGLDFILSHFEGQIFPRTISTLKTQNRQVEVFHEENALNLYEYSQFIDCKINAYPPYTEWKGINRQAPSFIFIDLDKSTFKDERAHSLALKRTLKNLKEKLGGAEPTVLWSGNGYHVYQPIDAFVLEQYDIFSEFESPSKAFLKFAEQFFSKGRCDPAHTPTFKSCMIRIPCSHNSKCISKNGSKTDSSTEIKIIQKWNGYRPKINYVLADFHAYLVQQKLKEIKRQKQLEKHRERYAEASDGESGPFRIEWIEKLLDTPIDDYRKNAVGLILAPYFINVRKYSYEDAFAAIKEWTDKCNTLKRLDSNFNYLVNYAIRNSMKNGYRPLRFENLKRMNNQLYNVLLQKL
jgi:hypothetical protein